MAHFQEKLFDAYDAAEEEAVLRSFLAHRPAGLIVTGRDRSPAASGRAGQADAADALKLLLVFSFLFFTSPVAAHSLANAAIKSGDKPRLGAFNDD